MSGQAQRALPVTQSVLGGLQCVAELQADFRLTVGRQTSPYDLPTSGTRPQNDLRTAFPDMKGFFPRNAGAADRAPATGAQWPGGHQLPSYAACAATW